MINRVLISAFSCLPNRGSEPGVGWNWAIHAAENKDMDITVLTREKCRPKIESSLSAFKLSNLHFIYVPSSMRLRSITIYLEYVKWQYDAYRYIRRNYSKDDFDCVWHITFGNVFLPIWIHKLPYKFIWGPMGGGEYVRPEFYKTFSLRDSLPHRLKYFLIKTAKLNPVVQGPAKRAKIIMARTEETKALISKKYLDKVQITLETRMDPSSLPDKPMLINDFDEKSLNVCYTGRLIALKNVNRLVAAVSSLVDEGAPIVLHLVGDGPLSKIILNQYARYVSCGSIILHGRLDREDALAVVASCPVFAFPSLKEGGSWSLMEAMMMKRAIICFDTSGMHEMLDDSSAIMMPLKTPDAVEDQFKAALSDLISNPKKVESIGNSAYRRVREKFGWDDVRTRSASVVRSVCE